MSVQVTSPPLHLGALIGPPKDHTAASNMIILDDDGDSFHTMRESYSYLSDIEWSAVGRMGSTIGEHTGCAMQSAMDRDEKHAALTKIIQHELDASREK